MKSVLFVINTLGRAGAETALISLLRKFDPEKYEIDLYVMLGQGDLIHRVPDYVHLLNTEFDDSDVLGKKGRNHITRFLLKNVFHRGAIIRNIPYTITNWIHMVKKGRVHPDKLMWKTISDSAPRFEKTYDLAVAYLEGGSAYYVSRYVKAKKKVCFIHTFYEESGYSAKLDQGAYNAFDKIFAVSDDSRDSFLGEYPEYADKTEIFHNIVDRESALEKAEETGGFMDDFSGKRLLTVARLNYQKALDVSIRAMRILLDKGYDVRWYVIGEGEERPYLESLIKELHLENDFLLLGMKENPFPYFRQCDIYVQSSRFEGLSITVQEAQFCGCAIVASDCAGNRLAINDRDNGLLVPFTSEGIATGIQTLLDNPQLAASLAENAAKREWNSKDLPKLLAMLDD